METLTLAETADGERLLADDTYSRAMRMSSLALLRAVERAQGMYITIVPARRPAPRITTVRAIPGEGLGRGIIRAVSAAYDMDPAALVSKARTPHFVCARAIAIRLLRDLTWQDGSPRFSLPQIGRLLGGRDHTTVHHALGMFEVYCRAHPFMKAVYDTLRDDEAGE
jgi:chromosomal replication initiation ATPase DnaA